jgi:GNAT superfamily N-acetyltransferase
MFEDMGHADEIEMLDGIDASFEGWVRERLERGVYYGFLAENEAGEVVAGAGCWIIEWPAHILDLNTKRAYVLNVYTEKAHRGHGLARRLMETVLDFCEARGLNIIVLHASQFGQPLYESMGFTLTNEMRLVRGTHPD